MENIKLQAGRQTVSVLVAAFNAAETIARAITSALGEPQVSQVIVVDDGSSDATWRVAQTTDDGTGRLLVLRLERNQGPSAARNLALSRAEGDWITILDADDYLRSGRFGRLLRHAGEADFIADDLFQIQEHEPGTPRETLLGSDFTEPVKLDLLHFVESNVTRKGTFRKELGFIKPLIRRSLLEDNGIRYDETLRLGEDYVLYCRLFASGARAILCPAAGYVSVIRKRSLSGNHSIDDLRRLREADKQLLNLQGLSREEKQALNAHARSVDCRLQWRLLIVAVKQRNPVAALKTFLRPPPVPQYLLSMLLNELVVRTRGD